MADSSTLTHTALITGGARRIGRHVALHLARLGWDIAITYHTSGEAMSTLADEMERLGQQFVPVRADFTDPAGSSEKVGHAVEAHFPRLDLLLHNASIYEPNDLDSVTLDALRRDWAVHVETPLLLTRRLRPLLESAQGTVLTMTDIEIERSRPSYLSYQLSKSALANLTRNLARELAPKVTANAIAPGAVLWAEGMTDEQQSDYLQRVPLAHIGSPRDVAELVEFLVTRGRYITGQTIRLDGGRSLR